MSRIRFEWNIESQRIDRTDAQDPQLKLRRRRNVLRLLFLVALLLALIGLAALAVRQRLIDVRNQNAQLLQDTVKAEVAALRIGDLGAWLKFKEPSSEAWLDSQRALFRHYEGLKAEGTIALTGSIVAVHIDDSLARVLVQEDIQESPYVRLWFYRRSDAGWLHIAPGFSFWGEDRVYTGAGVRVSYRDVDQQFAQQVGDVLVDWRQRSCNLLNCGDIPVVQVEIVPNAIEAVAWMNEQNLRLRLQSPYVDIARADLPFDGAYRLQVSRLLTRRLTEEHSRLDSASYPHDAYFIHESALKWLSEWLVGVNYTAGLIQSLAQNYGEQQVAHLLSVLSAIDDMSTMQEVVPVAIERADLDWRDFIAWRLQTEAQLITARAENDWLQLYDTSNESVRIAAYERFNLNAPPKLRAVIDHVIWTAENGIPQLRVTAEFESVSSTQVEIVLFNLIDKVWKRAN